MGPRVSVIIPTYNRADWVLEAVLSVLHQTYREFELIVVDDGSEDGTLERLGGVFRQIIGLRCALRRGVSAARNLGAQLARGEWLAFLDSDDLWLPGKLARQMAYLEAHPELLICQTEELWIKNGVRVNPPKTHRKLAGDLFLPSLKRCMVSPSAVVLSRRLFEEMGGFDENLPAAEDYDLWLRICWRHPVGLVPEPLVIKRGGHDDQLSRQWGLDRWRIAALQKILAIPELPSSFREAARCTLEEKCRIYAQGCAKRGKLTEAQRYYDMLADPAKIGPIGQNRLITAPNISAVGEESHG
uniref:Glycosyltransferase n=1 Tax=Desulfobacca acetoxidans TaxID=60893 RepID=A0A7C5AL13_9BACT